MLILCDLDGVLRDTVTTALLWIQEKYKCKFEKREWKSWDPVLGGYIQGAEAAWAVVDDPLWTPRIPAIPYAASATKELCDMGHEIVIVTCAPQTSEALVLAWLKKHKITFQCLRFFKAAEEKAAYPGHVLVDDRTDTVAHFGGKLGILFNQPWNQRHVAGACFTIDAPMGQKLVDRVLTEGGIIRAIGWKHVVRIVKRMDEIEKKLSGGTSDNGKQ